eukprot:2862739-Rhodomonas_salina.2
MERWLQTKTTSPLTNEVPSRPVPRPCLIGSRAEKRGTGLVTCSWRTQSAVQRERTGTKKVVVWYTEGGSVVLNSVVNRRGGVVLNAVQKRVVAWYKGWGSGSVLESGRRRAVVRAEGGRVVHKGWGSGSKRVREQVLANKGLLPNYNLRSQIKEYQTRLR